ncbi:MAG: MFS transporter, partial [Peptococcaceae bacterium]|nr:MFS transporter [Peptococcaceae bacterium]
MNRLKIKIAVLSFSALMMGAIGISGGLSVIGQRFAGEPQTAIQMLISLPCIVMIPFALAMGKLQEFVSKKVLVVTGILCYLAGGAAPAFCSSFSIILGLRAVLGVGLGILQPLSTVLIAEYFQGDERAKVMGQQASASMLGCAGMVLIGGYLADISWDKVFYVYLLGLGSLICVLLFLPMEKPPGRAAASGGGATDGEGAGVIGAGSGEGAGGGATAGAGKKTGVLTGAFVWWTLMLFMFFISGQVFSTFISFFIDVHRLGTAAQAGQTVMLFSLGGFVMGALYAGLVKITRGQTLTAAFAALFLSYMLMAYAPDITVVYLGCFLCGLAFSAAIPNMMVHVTNAVDAASAPMAISVALCSQNIAQFL